jgi:hypothetical protein
LSSRLVDETLGLPPECAVACEHLFRYDGPGSQVRELSTDDARARLHHILAGFEPVEK